MINTVTIPLLPASQANSLSRFFSPYRTAVWDGHVNGESSFARAGISSWIEWTSRNKVRFEIAEEMPAPEDCRLSRSQIEKLRQFPPTVQRWLLPMAAFRKYGPDSSMALVDADTIITPGAPSPFAGQHKTSVNLTKHGPLPAYGWNEWMAASCRAFAPLFPDVDLDPSLYFNAGVMVLNSPILARKFIEFTLARSSEFLAVMDGTVGTDQTPLNFLLQRLVKSGKLSASFLDPRWNARVDLILADREPDRGRWSPSLIKSVVAENFISHFITAKELMPTAWEAMREELRAQDSPREPRS